MTDDEWIKQKAKEEDGCFVSVGGMLAGLSGEPLNMTPFKPSTSICAIEYTTDSNACGSQDGIPVDICGLEPTTWPTYGGIARTMTPLVRGPHVLTDRDGNKDFCGGPGQCKWCDEEKI